MKLCSVVLCFLLTLTQVVATELAGIKLDDLITIANTKLSLNGAGIRSKFIFDIYVGGLYLQQPAKTTKAILSANGPKRVRMVFLYDEVSKEKLTNGWSEGFENNLSEAELSRLKSKITAFNGLFETVHKGDIIDLDYIPEKGTFVYYNSKPRGSIEGRAFNTALLKIWLGDEPADEALKEAMLGRDE